MSVYLLPIHTCRVSKDSKTPDVEDVSACSVDIPSSIPKHWSSILQPDMAQVYYVPSSKVLIEDKK